MENGLSTMDSKQVNYFVETADGSKTIYNPQVGENYHSRNGALQESEHVFLNSGLKYFLSLTPTLSSEGVLADNGARVEKVSILEVGFGTGLNFLLSANWCTAKEISLDYVGIEAFPLDEEMIKQTGYATYIADDLWRAYITQYKSSQSGKVNLSQFINLHVPPLQLMDLFRRFCIGQPARNVE
jgi:tRNA U34 5-methylaminomethyl-2-thiouridine-forming methyltransferase MnmC